MNGWILRVGTAAFFLCSAVAAPDASALRSQLALADEAGDLLAGIELMRRILEVDPGDDALRRRLIEVWLAVPDYDLAEATLTAWPEAPADLTALTRAAVQRFRDEDTASAIRTLRDYLATHPKDVAAHRALVAALLSTNDARAQVAALDALIALAPDAPSLIDRARARFRLADYPAALADARASQKLAPDDASVRAHLPTFERLEETLAALPPIDAALAKDPRDVGRLLTRAWWLRYGGILDRSLADANAALAVHPQSVAALITRDRAQYLLGQLKAEDALRTDLVDVNRAHSLEALQAVAEADAALARKPSDARALRQRARALNAAEQFLLAQRNGLAALDQAPKGAKAALETIYATTMLNEDPAPLLRRLEAMKPGKSSLAQAYAYLADLHLRRAQIALALELADRSLGQNESAYALRIKAAALQRLGRPEEARAVTNRANTLSP